MRFVRGVSIGILAVTVIAAARVAADQTGTAAPASPAPVADPLTKELDRCNQLGDQARNDPGCVAAAKESARRFFQPPGEYHPRKIDLYPNVPDPKTPPTPPSKQNPE